MKQITRREMLGRSSQAIAAAVGLPLLAPRVSGEDSKNKSGRLKVVVAGGHPDDPESGCGGTIALYSDLGHEVTILYLTRGEAGIKGKSHQEARRHPHRGMPEGMRHPESKAAVCRAD